MTLHLTNESLFFKIVTISHSLVFLFFTPRQKQAFILCIYISNKKSAFRRLVSVACNSLSNSRSSTLLGTNMKPHQDSPVTKFIAIQHCSQSITFMWSSYKGERKICTLVTQYRNPFILSQSVFHRGLIFSVHFKELYVKKYIILLWFNQNHSTFVKSLLSNMPFKINKTICV